MATQTSRKRGTSSAASKRVKPKITPKAIVKRTKAANEKERKRYNKERAALAYAAKKRSKKKLSTGDKLKRTTAKRRAYYKDKD